MKPKGIDLERILHNQQRDLLLQQLFTGTHVPDSLVGMVRSFQEACIAQGIKDKLNFKESLVERCEIQIGTLHLDLTTLDEEKVRKSLKASEQAERVVDRGNERKEQVSGQIAWQFTGVNQFGAVTIRVKERSWQVEFSRLQRRISTLITDETVLKPKAHQALYKEMKRMLQPMVPSESSQLLILQGAPGLGKSHCTEHYFYHDAHHHHQMVAWLCGESKEAFLRDWKALADQLRAIDSKRKDDSDVALIRHWCEEQLGQWLFIIDDLQIEIDWLKQYLPQKGGHVLITTVQPCNSLPEEAKILSFSPLSSEDSVLLLKAWLGKYWEAAGYTKEAQALSYFSEALGGWPALLTQIALLVRKKGLSFERVMGQFQAAETRSLLLADTVFDQLKDQTFLECVKKSWRQWKMALGNYYPQFTYQEHEAHLKQFIGFLKQQVIQAGEDPQVYVDENLILAYWQGVWTSLSCAPLAAEQIATCLNLLPFSYDKANHRWAVSLAGLHALECQSSEKDLSPFPALPEVTAISPVFKEKSDLNLPQIPSGVSLSIGLENAVLGYAEIALFTVDKPAEFTTWQLPTTNPYFIPRPKLTDEIAEKLPHKNMSEKSAELVLAAASGMGGIGKTELARHFITEPSLSSHYKKRFWFNAVSASALRNEFHNFASYLGLIESKEYLEDKALIHRLHRWFNLKPGWLMILDNADDYNSIAQWIPKEGGAVLITTRAPTPGTLIDEQIVKVPLLEPEEAITWLYQLAQRNQNTATETEQKAARELVEDLGCLPLAIAQSAAYLREQETVSIKAYQQSFLELLLKDESLVERDKSIDKRSDAYSRRVIASTWKLSLKMIEAYAKKKGIPNISHWLLAACSYLAPKDISLGLLECWFKEFFNLKDISPQLLSYLLDEYTAQLLRYSLCERAELTSMISMHRLVQEILRSSLTKQKALPAEILYPGEQKGVVKEAVFASLTVALLNYSVEFTPSIEDRKRRIDLISHLQRIIASWETLDPQDEIKPKILLAFYGRLAAVQLDLRADAKEALMLYPKELDLSEKLYGPEHPVVARTLGNLGIAYGVLGDSKQKKILLERALPIFEHHYGLEHPEVAIALASLGNAYGDLGDAKQKKNLLERALPIFEHHYGPEHPHVAKTLNNLGIVYGALGDAKQQKIYLERALRINEHYYGPEHPEVATTLANVGDAYGALGDAKQQKIHLERALPIFEHHYGPEHPYVATMLTKLGITYGVLGDAKQTKNLLERALRINEHYYGPEHHEVAITLTNLGNAYGDLGDAKQKKNLLERALPIFEHHYGPEHPQVAKTLTNLGNAHGTLGDAKQRKSLLERALRINEHYYGPEHPEVAIALASLGNAHGALGDAKQRKSLLERALRINEHYYGLEHLEVAIALASLGNAHGALGDAKQQKSLLERALRINEHYYGPEHPQVAITLTNLGNAYGALGDAKQRKSLLERALRIEEHYYGPEHPQLAITLFNLSYANLDLKFFDTALQQAQRCLLIFQSNFGEEHPHTKKAKNLISKCIQSISLSFQKETDNLLKQDNVELTSNLTLGQPLLKLNENTSYKLMGDLLLLQYQQPLDAISYYEKALDIDPRSPGIHHNLACCYHIRGNVEKANLCFQRGITLFPTPEILAEYSHFLTKHRRFQESLSFSEQCLQKVTDGGLSYGISEYTTVLSAIQDLIDKRSSQSIELSAQGLAHYLQVLCYQMCQQKEQAQEAMKRFELWIAQQPDPQQQEIFKFLKNSLIFEAESITLNLPSLEQQLFHAAVAGDLNVVQTIIENQDFSIDFQERDFQRTALHLACISQQRDVIAYLLSKLARFDIKDKEEKFAWEYVINTPLLELFKTTSAIFTQKYSAAVNAGIFMDWEKVLRMAVVNNYLADVRFLIEVKGIDINSVDANPKTGYTALHLAVIRNKPEIVKYLFSKGADINALDASKKTSLDYIKPGQEELLVFFNLSTNNTSAEECGFNFEKLHL